MEEEIKTMTGEKSVPQVLIKPKAIKTVLHQHLATGILSIL